MSELRRAISPPFLVAAAVLLLSAVAVHGVIWARGMQLIKQEAPLRQPLFLIQRELGPYERVEEHRLSSEELEEVGTDQYVMWTYRGRSGEARGRTVHLFLAYHTGMPEARPRVSEQAHLVPGRATDEPICRPLSRPVPRPESHDEGRASDTDEQATSGIRDDPPMLCVRYVTPSGGRGADLPVAYAFIVNGRLVGSREAVHAVWTDPHVSRAWWAKLEVRVEGVTDADETRQEAEHFLTYALPAIAEVLPAGDGEDPGADGE